MRVRLAGPIGMSALLALLLARAVSAQTIQGVVVEDSTKRPIVGATVELVRPDGVVAARSISGRVGEFHMQLSAGGQHRLRLTHPSYRAPDSDTLTVAIGESVTLELRMSPAAIPLAPLTVTARVRDAFGGFYKRARAPGFGHFLTREQIERRAGVRATDLLRGVPGILVVPAHDGAGVIPVYLVTMRGTATGRCLPMLYVDGMPIRQEADGLIDQMLTADMLEGVEVYTSLAGVPPRFQSLESCGVVAFWTRADAYGRWSWWKLAAGVGSFVLAVILLRW